MIRKTKIICTLGPAVDEEAKLEELMKAGMNVARFNFSHGDHTEQQERLERFKKIREKLNIPVAALLDTKGPEIRIKTFATGEAILKEGSTFTLLAEEMPGDDTKVSVTYPDLAKEVKIGTSILINDGLIEIIVKEIKGADVVCTVVNGGKISNKKSINIPNVSVNLPSLTDKDISDVKFAADNNFDFIAASFIRKASDIDEINKILADNGKTDVKIIAKIENREGIDNFDEILEKADGIMVARGDLGVEIPMEEVPIRQKEFIKKCNKAGKIVITATQMLESMVSGPRPTRAEVSDVANAIYDQTGAIMLSAESAAGKYPTVCVETMDKIARSIENTINYWKRFEINERRITNTEFIYNLNHATCNTAKRLDAKAIVAYTHTGSTAQCLSGFSPKCPIYAITDVKKVYNQLSLTPSVRAILIQNDDSIEQKIKAGIEILEKESVLTKGDLVVIAGGASIVADENSDMNQTIGGVYKI